jgi:adenylyltransferase/sulfurtransferase
VLPGIVGSIQAMEALKLLLGTGETLVGRLLLFDAMKMAFRELALERDPACPACGAHPTLDRLIDYEAWCGVAPAAPARGEMAPMELTVHELKDALEEGRRLVLLDVREPWEFDVCHIAGSRLVPLGSFAEAAATLDAGAEYVTICHTGRRSLQAALFLKSQGIERVRSLRGGVEAWAVTIDPAMPRY